MRLRAYRGVRLWPAVLAEWALRAAAVVLPPAALAGGAWLIWGTWIAATAGTVVGAGAAVVATGVLLGRTGETLFGHRLRYALAQRPGPDLHARAVAELAAKDPQRGERMLREEVAAGGVAHLRELAGLLYDARRHDEEDALARQIAETGTVEQLRDRVRRYAQSPVRAVPLQAALVARLPGDGHERLLHAALLAERRSFAAALAEVDAARPLLGRAPLDRDDAPLDRDGAARLDRDGAARLDRDGAALVCRVAAALVAARRLADAERVLRLAVHDPWALATLAGLLVRRRKAAEAERLLRAHPDRTDQVVGYALYLVLRATGRGAEADALVPPGGWPQQRARRRTGAAAASSSPASAGWRSGWDGGVFDTATDIAAGSIFDGYGADGGGSSPDGGGFGSDGGGFGSDSGGSGWDGGGSGSDSGGGFSSDGGGGW